MAEGVKESVSSSLQLECGQGRNEGIRRDLPNLRGFLGSTQLSAGWEEKHNVAKNESLSRSHLQKW